MGFDIAQLNTDSFPQGTCPRCAAILRPALDLIPLANSDQCPICSLRFARDLSHRCWPDFRAKLLKFYSAEIPSENILEHSRSLAKTLADFRDGKQKPLGLLFELIARSKHFVHFATYNLTSEMIGLLAMAATRISVRGIVGERLDRPSDIYKTEALNAFSQEVYQLHIQLSTEEGLYEGTHQKLYIFDGLVALIGSPNLTLTAWRKLEEDKELLEIVTDLDRVRMLNNRYFSKHFRDERFIWDPLPDLGTSYDIPF